MLNSVKTRKTQQIGRFLAHNINATKHYWSKPMSEFIKLKPIAAELQIGASTIRKMVANGEFPKPVTIGGSNRWIRSEVNEWKEQQIASRDAALANRGA